MSLERCHWCGKEKHNSFLLRTWHNFMVWRYHAEVDLEYGKGKSEEIAKSNDEYWQAEALTRWKK